MRDIDVWFAKSGDAIYFSFGDHDEPPTTSPRRVTEVREVLRRLKKDYQVVQVGIVPPDMIGIE